MVKLKNNAVSLTAYSTRMRSKEIVYPSSLDRAVMVLESVSGRLPFRIRSVVVNPGTRSAVRLKAVWSACVFTELRTGFICFALGTELQGGEI
jgi:hypothetical protein